MSADLLWFGIAAALVLPAALEAVRQMRMRQMRERVAPLRRLRSRVHR